MNYSSVDLANSPTARFVRLKLYKFLQEFQASDLRMVMQHLRQTLLDYEANQFKLAGMKRSQFCFVAILKRGGVYAF